MKMRGGKCHGQVKQGPHVYISSYRLCVIDSSSSWNAFGTDTLEYLASRPRSPLRLAIVTKAKTIKRTRIPAVRPRMIQLFLTRVERLEELLESLSARAPDALLVFDEPVIFPGQSLLPDENDPSYNSSEVRK